MPFSQKVISFRSSADSEMSVVVAQASRGTCRPSSKRKLNPIKGIACPRLMRLNTLVLGLSFLERVCVITGLKYIEN